MKSYQSDFIEIGYSKLNRISQFKDDENFDEWIAKAKTLSKSDLNLEIRETKGIAETLPEKQKSDIREITCPYCAKQFNYMVKE